MLKRKNISGLVKRDTWLKYVGNKAKTVCFCCKKMKYYFAPAYAILGKRGISFLIITVGKQR